MDDKNIEIVKSPVDEALNDDLAAFVFDLDMKAAMAQVQKDAEKMILEKTEESVSLLKRLKVNK